VTLIPSSKSTFGYRVGSFDVAATLTAPILALWIRDLDAFYSVSPITLYMYILVSFVSSIWFFVCFHVARGLPNYFSLQDAVQIIKATFCAVVSTTTFAFVFMRTAEYPG